MRQAGNILRDEIQGKTITAEQLIITEEKLMYKALKDMNLSKLVKDDIKLFESLLDDVFVNKNDKDKPNEEVLKQALAIIKEDNYIVENKNAKICKDDAWLSKIMQLYDTNCVRHAIMVVGPTGCGKSVIIETLKKSLTNKSKQYDYPNNPEEQLTW